MLSQFILPGISLGLSATSVPGPLQAYLLNVTLRYGWQRGILVIFAPLIVDTPVIIVTVFLLGQLPQPVLEAIRVAGGLLLLYIAWGAYQQFRQGAQFGPQAGDGEAVPTLTRIEILRNAVLMNALSPGPYLFWATVNGPLLIAALEQSIFHALGFLLAFYGTFLGGMALLVALFDRIGRINAQITRWLIAFTVVLLVWFGTRLIAEAFGLLHLHQIGAAVAAGLGLLWLGWRWQRTRATSQP